MRQRSQLAKRPAKPPPRPPLFEAKVHRCTASQKTGASQSSDEDDGMLDVMGKESRGTLL